ncbi:MAG TPA: recombinase family protein, partial [Steroidobacteraceae bacterium]
MEQEQQPSPKRRAYSYVRFSTPEQLRGDSLRRQTEAAAEFARRHNLLLDTELTFRDLGVSAFRGANADRGALRMFLRAVEDGVIAEGSVLILENLDRMSRKAPWEALPTLQSIINAGVALGIPMKDRIIGREDLAGPSGVFLLMEILIDLQRAHEESATKSRRLKAAWAAKRERAYSNREALTAMTPAWIEKTGDSFEVIQERAEVVRWIFRRFLEGAGKEAIARALNEQRVPTFGRGRRKGRHWHRSYVQKILTNRAVLGEFTPHTDDHEHRSRV